MGYYYIELFLYGYTIVLRLFCDDPDLDDEIIEVKFESQKECDFEISDMSLCINSGKYEPSDYEISIKILDDFLKQLDYEVDLSDFKEKIKNKFFNFPKHFSNL